ncbi:DUF917 domain-containing protein [Paremcibacter congregatus]|uniref:DUF917 domain-containing protein n=1 Tax=Paremcibacter congregatus TaxID=2043170 RepID=A0A2G4YWF1_9PROT|nr:DUF917 domain-containing protein [Paremcibacter congregatus]PHZ86583.1 hypothetical protein CRD36_01505 [Paremcibacter congregatus]QDE26388.1 DUF917 domain-containing protein [Paremcibacter congregatus]|tara:strand:- start:1761 stop:2846 length:1086 start_codon:yes stop_codon:yes gene_type:complete
MKITLDNMEDFARGAAFLGTGGGGDPYIGRMLAQNAIKEFGAPEVITADELADDAVVLTAAMLGSPPVLLEKACCGDDIDLAIRKLEEKLGRKADAILPIEIGGVNSTLPIMAAARLGLPVVDADGMGRAFPELQMVTFNVYGCSATPLVVTDEHLNSVLIEADSGQRAEGLVRAAAIQMGLSVMISSFPLNGRQVKDYAVHGTLSLALGIGIAIREGRTAGNPVEELVAYLKTTPYYNQAKILFDGKVTDLRRETTKGFAIGHCLMDALDGSGRQMEIIFQNEHLVARENGITKAIVPDLICMVDRETAEPIPVEHLRYGQRIKIIGTSAAPIMRTPEALQVFGPRIFGLNEDFIPIEQL